MRADPKSKHGKPKRANTPPPPRKSWVKKSHAKRNLVISVAVILLVGLGIFSVSQQPAPGSAVQIASTAWKGASLTDAGTQQKFTLSQFSGKVVVLELMAMWCGSCRVQGQEIAKVAQNLAGNDQVVIVTVDVDRSENLADLAAYVRQWHFGAPNSTPPWYYATDDTGQLLASLVGTVNLHTYIPSTPTYIIDKSQSSSFTLLTHSTVDIANPARDIVAAIDKAIKA